MNAVLLTGYTPILLQMPGDTDDVTNCIIYHMHDVDIQINVKFLHI